MIRKKQHCAALLVLAVLVSGPADAQSTPRHPNQQSTAPTTASAGPNGGSVREVGAIQIETVVSQSGIQLYIYDKSGKPTSADGGRGAATLRVAGNTKRYRYDLLPDGKGGLTAPVNLSKFAGRQVELDIQLVGIFGVRGRVIYQEVANIPPSEEQLTAAAIARQKLCPVSGKPLGSMGQPVAVEVASGKVYVCCAGCADALKADPSKYAAGRPKITVTSATEADTALIKRQANCPVMDEPLGSMGQPIKVMVGDRPIFLCCKGCIKKIQAEPTKYLTMVYGNTSSISMKRKTAPGTATLNTVPAGADQVRTGVFKVTAADARFIAAQKTCPVMDEPLDAMGGPFKVNAAGKAIYICCPGCAKKIVAEPQKYLTVLASRGVKAPVIQQDATSSVPIGTEQVRDGVFKVSRADAPFIAAQKTCPVMDEPLDAMGGPFQVNAAGKAVYICCPGCGKKVAADPQKYLDILAKQGVSPPSLR